MHEPLPSAISTAPGRLDKLLELIDPQPETPSSASAITWIAGPESRGVLERLMALGASSLFRCWATTTR